MGTRLKNWEQRLVLFVDTVLGASFKWGERDCATLVLRGYDAMYGTDHRDWATWTSIEGMWRQVRSTPAEEKLMAMGAEVIDRPWVFTGDAVLGYLGESPSLYLICGKMAVSASEELGVHWTPKTAILDLEGFVPWRFH